MDVSVVLLGVFEKAWFLIPLAMLAALLKSSWFKGFVGEALVNLSAQIFLDKEDYHLKSDWVKRHPTPKIQGGFFGGKAK